MTLRQGLILGVVFLVIALAGSAGISYGVVELAGAEGPQGGQGLPGPRGLLGPDGPQGERGPTCLRGPAESSGVSVTDFDPTPGLLRLTNMWALNNVIEQFDKPGLTSSDDPQVEACRDYVLFGEGSFVECGFER